MRQLPSRTLEPSASRARARAFAGKVLLVALFLATLGGVQAQSAGAPEPDAVAPPDAVALLDRILGNLRGSSQIATVEMTVVRPDREEGFTLRIYSAGDDRGLTRVIAPPRAAGQAFLNDGDNLFLFNPRLKRVLRLPPSGRSDSFLGSDISYDDLAGDDLRDSFTARVLEESDDAITLELVPMADAPTPFGKVHISAVKPSYAPTRITYFDQRDQAIKENRLSDFVVADGRSVPQRFEVADLLEEGNRTIVIWRDAEFGVAIPEACLTPAALEREGVCP